MTRDIYKQYETGAGHIDARGERFLVSFYGRRVVQQWAATLEEARFALRQIARSLR